MRVPTPPPARYDAVIVGAGPAGSTAAILLARAGWAVALVERQRFPRRKVCGECVSAGNLPLLDALGLGPAFAASAGAELRQVTLLHGDDAVTADLPAADDEHHRWGRALGRETLDTLLLMQAQAAGVTLLQPWSVQAIEGQAGAWHCELRTPDSAALLRLRAVIVIDAHGSWEGLPASRPQRLARGAGDLFAFKANFHQAPLAPGTISLMALAGGYGGMVIADDGIATLACCVRRDRLSQLRGGGPGLRAGDAVETWLRRDCRGVTAALAGAQRDGPWLAAGPLDPGMHLRSGDEIFRIGNAAGEAHPILGEGISMALQSAALLCRLLVGDGNTAAPAGRVQQAELQHRYRLAWRQAFAPRLRLAALFAQVAMRPRSAALLMSLARAWPGLLTWGARRGGKVTAPILPTSSASATDQPGATPWTAPSNS